MNIDLTNKLSKIEMYYNAIYYINLGLPPYPRADEVNNSVFENLLILSVLVFFKVYVSYLVYHIYIYIYII